MIEKFAIMSGLVRNEFIDLKHTSQAMLLVSLLISKFARDQACEHRRTSESGH
jgi:hypothetical protein